jgi:glycosyltransferase involved in cell wall biosynthesis
MERIHTKGVSIIICTYNGKDRLGSTLDFIQKIQFDLPWELVLVDNASKDGTIDFVSQYLKGSDLDYKLLSCPTPGKNFALWMAFQNCQYEYVLICDDDNHLFSNYLAIGFQVLEANSQIGALGGQGLIPASIKFPEWLKPFKKAYALGPQEVSNGNIGKNKILYGAGCFFRIEAILKLAEFNFKTFMIDNKGNLYPNKEDAELCLIIKSLGYELWYNEKLKFYHNLDPQRLEWKNFVELKKQQASVFPILDAYNSTEIESLNQFQMKLISIYFSVIKFSVLAYFDYLSEPSEKKRIQFIEYKQRVFSFHKNWKQSIAAFNYIKSIRIN